jgi:acetyltransferase-like isoleucine patch superfamily enzyme
MATTYPDVTSVVVETDTRIQPFDEHPRELPVLNRPLAAHRADVLDSLDIRTTDEVDPGRGGPQLVFDDTVFFSEQLLRSFLEESRGIDEPTQCAVEKGAFTERAVTPTMALTDHGDGVGYRLYYYPDGFDPGEEVDPRPVTLDADEFVHDLAFPEHMVQGGTYRVPITTTVVVQIEHWANLWAANVVGALGRLAALMNDRFRQLNLALRAFSTNEWKIAGRNVTVGENCDVHPTAHVENSILGDGVEIGAGSVVRGSIIDDRTVIQNNVSVAYSVIGERCQFQHNTSLSYSLLFPGAFTNCLYLNCSVMGRDTFIGAGTIQTDFRFDGNDVVVLDDGAPVDSGQRFLGGCMGHESYLGAGLVIAPGREIPNGVRVMPSEDDVVSNVARQPDDFQYLSPDEVIQGE